MKNKISVLRKGDNMKTAEEIRDQIIKSVFNNPILGENYVDWHTDNLGECGVTFMYKNQGVVFDIVIRMRDELKNNE